MANTGFKSVTFYTSLIITILYVIAFVVISFSYYSFTIVPLIISTPLMFLFSYLVIRISLDNFIYAKIKLIYKTIGEFKEDKPDIQYIKKHKSLEKVNQVVIEWSNEQKKKIDELKQMATYRREFLGNISHELKTPIFNIQGYILTLLDGGLEDESVNRAFLKKANKSIKRMIAIVEDLEEISKLESGVNKLKESLFDINELTREVVDFMEMKAKSNKAKVVAGMPMSKIYQVMADKERIRQVLINLIDNAIKYGNKEETIIKIGIYDFDKKYLIEVSDNGLGIEKKNLARVFERFYRTDKGRSRDKGGTGLGLAIVKHIIEAHRQTITVSSQKGKGTTFSFTLQKG